MNINRYLKADYLPIPLIAAMVLTRFHHFGDVLHLPDASLAVFFFAGFFRKKMLLGFLLALAALIDYVAISNGTSSWCVTPAYVFLIPTYAVMWYAGRYCSTMTAMKGTEVTLSVGAMGLLALATSLAFVISNGSFYVFSDRYTEMSWLQYLDRVVHYYPLYMSSTLIYGIVGYALVKLIKAVVATQDGRKTV
ncbi:conserved membrane hypothetical protein [Crenothrix polyspora]|uniref:Uncharacterized protein n=1 Tax=Crenothrix polyspora TaxID=360316 RepID=A0A1R4H7A3_9GAMM|nr:hypothetical protein [Crenothrix polyspora]SJM92133.1 conserved membrane hypothetical protein [Crenothrix polyspora]